MERVHWYVCCEEDFPVVEYPVPLVFYWRPTIRKTVLRDGEWADASEPAFPGYLLVGSPKGWRHIEASLPDLQLIRVDGRPHELTERELALARLFDRVQFNVASEPISPGDNVRATRRSAYHGMVGRVVQRVPVRGGEQALVEFGDGGFSFGECVPLDHLERARG